ncbi:hypothetical protein CDIK_2298, partial [Cucumispora dikerogammari]
ANFKYENDYDISQKICFTKNDEQFLYFDSRKDNENRVIVFTTKQNMNHIEMNKIWVCDGTFKTAPKEFEQLFTIQCLIRGKYVPLYHCFIKKRAEASYKIVFCVLFEKYRVKKPENIIMNFEQALFRSIKQCASGVKLWVCLFHLNQIVWRRIQSLDLTRQYKNYYTFRINIKMKLA